MSRNPSQANTFVALVSAAGLCSLACGLTQHAANWHPREALILFAIGVAAARMKVKLPGLTGTMSVNLPFVLLAVTELNLLEALLVACASTAAQCWPKAAKAKPVQMLFNIASMASAVALGWQLFHHGANGLPAWLPSAFVVPLAVSGFFLLQTVPVSIVIALTDGGPVQEIWSNIAQLTFPYYVLSAGVASIAIAARQHFAGAISLIVLVVMYGSYRSFQAYFRREAPEDCSLNVAKAAAAAAS